MRKTNVYVLRLVVDEAEPGALRGMLRNVKTGEEISFSNEQALLKLLRERTAQPPAAQDINEPLNRGVADHEN